MGSRELANRIVSVLFSDEHLFFLLPTSKKWEQLVDKAEQEIQDYDKENCWHCKAALDPNVKTVTVCPFHGTHAE